MPKTVSKTFRIPLEVAKEIELEARKNNVSQAQFIVTAVTENKFLKLQRIFEDNIKNMENDEAYKKEQIELAEADFL